GWKFPQRVRFALGKTRRIGAKDQICSSHAPVYASAALVKGRRNDKNGCAPPFPLVSCDQTLACANLAKQTGEDCRAFRPRRSRRYTGTDRRRPTLEHLQATVFCRESPWRWWNDRCRRGRDCGA